MLTVGVDLAAQPENTAVAVVQWHSTTATVIDVRTKADDDSIVEAAAGADKVGIDCPLGWPDDFVEFVSAHQEGTIATYPDQARGEWFKSLRYRRTDRKLLDIPGPNPLSVSTDRIGVTAMRAARLLSAFAHHDGVVDRTGSGRIVEVYPAAALRTWDRQHTKYKGTKNLVALDKLVSDLPDWLVLGEYEERCRRSDHVFDAVIAALIARAAALGLVTTPSEEDLPIAAREGWIAVPTCSSMDPLIAPEHSE